MLAIKWCFAHRTYCNLYGRRITLRAGAVLVLGAMNMKIERLGAGIAGIILGIGFGLSLTAPAEAACRQVLAPNRWQYITVCDGNRGGADYSGAIAAGVVAGAIAIELLPGVLGAVGEVTSGVGDVTSGVVNNLGNAGDDVLQQYLAGRNQNSGGLNDGTLNPFNAFNQRPEVAAPAAKKKNAKKEDETPSLLGFLTPAPQVNTPTVNATAPEVNSPSPFNIFAPQVNTPTTRVKTPRTNTPTAQQAKTPQVSSPSPFNIFAPQVNTPSPRVE
jgi:hypothetical protein